MRRNVELNELSHKLPPGSTFIADRRRVANIFLMGDERAIRKINRHCHGADRQVKEKGRVAPRNRVNGKKGLDFYGRVVFHRNAREPVVAVLFLALHNAEELTLQRQRDGASLPVVDLDLVN